MYKVMATLTAPAMDLPGGHKMPMVGLGTWQGPTQTDSSVVAANIEKAVDIGYRHFDTAQNYGTEVGIGQGIQSAIIKGKVKREDLFITTKLCVTHFLREDVVRHLRKSLDRLKLTYVDLFLIHWPCPVQPSEDEIIPKDAIGKILYADDIDYLDTWKGMEEALGLGLTKNIGISNFNKRQMERLLDNCTIKPATNQVEASLLFQNTRLIKFCQTKGIHVVGYRSLQYHSGGTCTETHKTDKVAGIASRLGKTVHQVALRFQIQRGVTVIPKSSNETRLRQNLEAVNFELTDTDMKALETFDTNKRNVDHLFTDSKGYPFNDPY